MAAEYEIEEYSRLALTGDVDAATPSDATLAPYVLRVERREQAKYPCIASIPASGTDADQEAYNEYIGTLVAIEYVKTPAGQAAIGATGGTTEVRLGPVTEKSQATTVTSLTTDLTAAANAARSQISCIRARFAGSDTAGVMSPDLTGRRRTMGDAVTVEGDLLGMGDGVVRRIVP